MKSYAITSVRGVTTVCQPQIIRNGVNGNVTMQLGIVTSPTAGCVQRNVLYQVADVHQQSFELKFEIKVNNLTNPSGDMFSVFFGYNPNGNLNNLDNMPVGNSNNGYKVVFGMRDNSPLVSKGLFLYGSNGLVKNSTSLPIFDNKYREVIIRYNKGNVNTWTVKYNGVIMLTFSDNNNTNWLSSKGNKFWGFYAANSDKYHTSFIRKVKMTRIFPYVAAVGKQL